MTKAIYESELTHTKIQKNSSGVF